MNQGYALFNPYPDRPMQELLVDALTGDQVILTPARATRPNTFRAQPAPPPAAVSTCPFCETNEHETPPEVMRIPEGTPDTPGWKVRVVPNKYPIVGDGVTGAHEVVVLSPAHNRDLGLLNSEAAADVLRALRERARFHLDRGLVHAQPFVNHGKAAGASIEHPHAQLLVLDFVPPRVQTRLARFTPEAIRADQQHVVASEPALVWCPPASTSPFMQRVALADAGPRFDQATDDELTAMADALCTTAARLHRLLDGPAYNLVFETAPRDHDGPFQWWVDVLPRVSVLAGFELGTGVYVNTVTPAAAAAELRTA